MHSAPEQQRIFSILNFAGPTEATALAQDISTLGYRPRLEQGGLWLRRGQRAKGAKVVLVGARADGEAYSTEIVSRLRDIPWICILDRRGEANQILMRAATDFLQAPWTPDELAIRLERFSDRIENRRRRLSQSLVETGIVGRNRDFCATLSAAERIAPSPAPVIIEGETGTGKEMVARLIHRLGSRRKAFVPVNCGCLPADLVENELFGHQAGAFTGANSASDGLVEQANGGTLFLDEIDTLPPRAQVALLRFLQSGEVRPVGGGVARKVDVRVIAASNRPLSELRAQGEFREDLYFRLNVVGLEIPPLRERRDDIADLVRHFLDRYERVYDRGPFDLSDQTVAWLLQHEFPGNVRQLENLVHRAVLSATGPTIALSEIAPTGFVPPSPASVTGVEPYNDARARAIARFEKRYLTDLMRESEDNVTAAAERAGKERRSLGRLLKKHQIGPSWKV